MKGLPNLGRFVAREKDDSSSLFRITIEHTPQFAGASLYDEKDFLVVRELLSHIAVGKFTEKGRGMIIGPFEESETHSDNKIVSRRFVLLTPLDFAHREQLSETANPCSTTN